nr:hypothetical protein CFP56_04818 [Quercus suber]
MLDEKKLKIALNNMKVICLIIKIIFFVKFGTLKDCPLRECDLINFFSFFNLFPGDYEIPARRLVALFNAVRSVKEGGEEKTKELVQHYLEALTRLNLIQVVEMNINGKVKKCRLPSALKDRFVFEIVSDKHLVDHCHGNGTNSSDLKIKYEDLISYLSFDTSEGNKLGEEALIAQNHQKIKSVEVFRLKVDLPGGNPIIHRQPTEPPNSGCEVYLRQNFTQIQMEVAETSTPILEPESSK